MAGAVNRLDSLGTVISLCIRAFARDSCTSNGDQGDEKAGSDEVETGKEGDLADHPGANDPIIISRTVRRTRTKQLQSELIKRLDALLLQKLG